MSTIFYKANQSLIAQITWTADRSSDAVPLTQHSDVGIHVVWSSLTGTLDGSIVVSVSNDGTNWDTVGTATTISTANGNKCIAIENVFFTFIKVDAIKNSITGGNISATCTFK